MMKVTIVFDVEDYVTPPEGGLDDLLKMLADVMTEERVSGTFFVIGEKLRCLRDRGRADVIAALARHDVGSHFNMGSLHPTWTERMETADWSDGVARAAAEELAGIEELSAILGRPVRSIARHGGSFSAQLVAALGPRELPYVYSPARLPNHNVTWYCNTLNFFESMTHFQEAYLSRAAFLEREKEFKALMAAEKGADWIGIFHSHPCMIKTAWFWDRNYFWGKNTPPAEWAVPEFRADFSMKTVRENWALHCARLREDPAIELGTISDFARQFMGQAENADGAEISALAAQAAEAEEPFFTNRFTAAEITDLLARAYTHRNLNGRLPERLARRNVLGPTQIPLSAPTARRLAPEAALRAARGLVTAVDACGMLPSRIFCGEGTLGSAGELGLGSAMVALGRALTAKDPAGAVETKTTAPYPRAGDEIVASARGWLKGWPCHRKDLELSAICRTAALQGWTLKPAFAGGPPEFKG